MTNDREQAIRNQLHKLLEHFERKRERSLLLQYVVQETLKGNTVGLTERILAKKVYNETLLAGDDKSSTVRNHASNLRDDLAEYYFTKGCNDDVIIRLPKPGYVPQFVFRSDASKPAGEPQFALEGSSQDRKRQAEESPSSEPRRAVISVEVPTDHVPEVFMKLTELVQRFPGQSIITAAYGRVGSRLFYLNCSTEGYEWLRFLWSRGELSGALGHQVNAVVPAEEVDLEMATARSRSLETCFSPVIDCSGLKLKKFTLTIQKLNPHTGSLKMMWMMYRSSDLITWRAPTTLFRYFELAQGAGMFSYSLEARSGWPLLLAFPVGLMVLHNERTGEGTIRAGSPIDGTFGGGFINFWIFIQREGPSSGVGDAAMALYIDGVAISGGRDSVEINARTISLDAVESESRQMLQEHSRARSNRSDDPFQPV